MNKKELRDNFFKEHTYKCDNGIPRVSTHPHNLFEWFYDKLNESQNKEDTIDCWISTRIKGSSASIACNGDINFELLKFLDEKILPLIKK